MIVGSWSGFPLVFSTEASFLRQGDNFNFLSFLFFNLQIHFLNNDFPFYCTGLGSHLGPLQQTVFQKMLVQKDYKHVRPSPHLSERLHYFFFKHTDKQTDRSLHHTPNCWHFYHLEKKKEQLKKECYLDTFSIYKKYKIIFCTIWL